jgi:hypothetical protein
MNIFYLDHSPVQAARYHNDKHVVKMILESAQMLSTAHRVLDGAPMQSFSSTGRKQVTYKHPNDYYETFLYKATHINHPCNVWVRRSWHNYDWLFELFIALLSEYQRRYHKTHKCAHLIPYLTHKPNHIAGMSMRMSLLMPGHVDLPPCAMPDECKVDNDPVASYRNYYVMYKSSFAVWNKGHDEMPLWFAQKLVDIVK